MALTKVNATNIIDGTLPVANGGTGLTTLGTAGQVLTVNGGATALQYSTPATTSPGGSTTQVQYNNAGAFGGSSSFVFDGTNVGIGGTPSTGYKLEVLASQASRSAVVSSNTNSAGSSAYHLATDVSTNYGNMICFGSTHASRANSMWIGTDGGNAPLVFQVNGSEVGRFDTSANFKFNSGYGSVATAYGCRAWVNFNGNSPTIRSSGGVSSVTRSSAGTYTVNLSVTMPDANYTVNCTCSANSGNNYMIPIYSTGSGATLNTPTTSSFTLGTWNNNFNAMLDPTYVCVSVFR
jgi:hypothetical protein